MQSDPNPSIFLTSMKQFLLISFLIYVSFAGQSQDWKSYYDQAVADYQSQRYPEALVKAEKAYEASKSLDTKSQAFSLQLLTAICLEAEDYKKGLGFSTSEIALFLQTEGQKSKHYAEALQKRAQMNQALSNWADAKKDYEEVLLIFYESPGQASIEYLKVQSNYGQVLLGLKGF